MKPRQLFIPIAFTLLSTAALAADAEAGLLAVKVLGGINGVALACSDTKSAARARELMLAHAPKTPRFGAAYEEATQEAFVAQTRAGRVCPSSLEITDELNRLALRLADALPAAAK